MNFQLNLFDHVVPQMIPILVLLAFFVIFLNANIIDTALCGFVLSSLGTVPWTCSSGSVGSNPCGLTGIECIGTTVSGIKLNMNQLVGNLICCLFMKAPFGMIVAGSIPSSIGALTTLTTLDLGTNKISG